MDTQTIVPETAEAEASASNGASNGAVRHAASNGAVANGASNGAVKAHEAAQLNGGSPHESKQDQEMALHGMTPTGLARRLGRCS